MPYQFDANPVTMIESTGTLSASNATLAANPNRRGVIVSNNSDTVMTLAIGSTASAAVGIAIPANTAITYSTVYVPTQALSLFCAGAVKAYTIYSW